MAEEGAPLVKRVFHLIAHDASTVSISMLFIINSLLICIRHV